MIGFILTIRRQAGKENKWDNQIRVEKQERLKWKGTQGLQKDKEQGWRWTTQPTGNLAENEVWATDKQPVLD